MCDDQGLGYLERHTPAQGLGVRRSAQVSIVERSRLDHSLLIDPIPPLESGDRLTCQEFERRYGADPYVRKAELIEGVVYVVSPLRHRQHGQPHSRILTWLGLYQAFTPGTDLSIEPTVRLDPSNEFQPDAVLFLESTAGGQTQISSEGYIEGAPELVVEIAASSASIDLGDKKRVYCRHGVQEYIVWQTHDDQVHWFVLDQNTYQQLHPDQEGLLRSQTFPGLWLPTSDLISGNMPKVLEVVQDGIRSEPHQDFIKDLACI